jgi:site-specific recombinase XerD
MSKITFSQAMQGYLLAIGARHLSEHTVKDYLNTFNKCTAFLGEDIPIEDITHKDIEAFFTAQTKVSNRTLLNYHTGLSCLWTWAMREHLVHHHVVRSSYHPSLKNARLCLLR